MLAKKKTILSWIMKQFEEAAKFGAFQLLVLTAAMAGLGGSMGRCLYLISQKMGENTWITVKIIAFGFYGTMIAIGFIFTIACLAGFWFKLSPRTKVAKVSKPAANVEQALVPEKA